MFLVLLTFAAALVAAQHGQHEGIGARAASSPATSPPPIARPPPAPRLRDTDEAIAALLRFASATGTPPSGDSTLLLELDPVTLFEIDAVSLRPAARVLVFRLVEATAGDHFQGTLDVLADPGGSLASARLATIGRELVRLGAAPVRVALGFDATATAGAFQFQLGRSARVGDRPS